MNSPRIAEPMLSRWSPSVFDATHELGDGQIAALLEAAQWAPSAGNSQPWRYVVAPRHSAAHKIVVPHLSRGNSGWVPWASAVFLSVIVVGEDGEEFKDLVVRAHDVGQASAHLTLQAHAMGLHAHQFAGFDHAGLAADLGIPAPARLMAGIAVGVRGNPADVSEQDAQRELRPRSRRPLSETAFGELWGVPFGKDRESVHATQAPATLDG